LPDLGAILGASTIGAVDVFYFHLYKLKLYRQPSSVVEELTHLAGYGSFLALAAAMVAPGDPAARRDLVAVLVGLYLVVTVVDVLTERSSRAPLGGLPTGEYLLHILIVFGFGAGAATFWWATTNGATGPLTGLDQTRVLGAIAFTTVLLLTEGTIFLRAVLSRRQPASQLATP
jgi:hypothetical protein